MIRKKEERTEKRTRKEIKDKSLRYFYYIYKIIKGYQATVSMILSSPSFFISKTSGLCKR